MLWIILFGLLMVLVLAALVTAGRKNLDRKRSVALANHERVQRELPDSTYAQMGPNEFVAAYNRFLKKRQRKGFWLGVGGDDGRDDRALTIHERHPSGCAHLSAGHPADALCHPDPWTCNRRRLSRLAQEGLMAKATMRVSLAATLAGCSSAAFWQVCPAGLL